MDITNIVTLILALLGPATPESAAPPPSPPAVVAPCPPESTLGPQGCQPGAKGPGDVAGSPRG